MSSGIFSVPQPFHSRTGTQSFVFLARGLYLSPAETRRKAKGYLREGCFSVMSPHGLVGSVSRNMSFFQSLLQVDLMVASPAEEVVMGRTAEEVAGASEGRR